MKIVVTDDNGKLIESYWLRDATGHDEFERARLRGEQTRDVHEHIMNFPDMNHPDPTYDGDNDEPITVEELNQLCDEENEAAEEREDDYKFDVSGIDLGGSD